MKLPPWLTKRYSCSPVVRETREVLRGLSLNTVCQEACCPNVNECYSRKTATFMILGTRCTRGCRFCAVDKGQPHSIDATEPERVAAAVRDLGLSYVVVTSVTRDDLPDGGAEHFARTIGAIRSACGASTRVEVLVPDFGGEAASLATVLAAHPFVLNHNVETVLRLYPDVRPEADYRRSLELLARSKSLSPGGHTKSGFMVGLGETAEEVRVVLGDLRATGCDIVTIGQYLRPSSWHLEVQEYITPAMFREYEQLAYDIGFLYVAAGPFVRSSYMADQWLQVFSAP